MTIKHNGDGEIIKARDEVIGRDVKNLADEELGEISEIMLEKESGKVAYAVLDSGSFLGVGGTLHAIPWRALNFDPDKECFVINIDKEKLKKAPGFDKDHWPNMADMTWAESITTYYNTHR